MTLTFPTMAEQVAEEFRTATRTVSIATLARKRGAEVEKTWDSGTVYTFDDDTTLVVTGRGRAHKIETHFP